MSIEGKIALVTGANGFVGTYVSRYLAERGATARALVRRTGDVAALHTGGIEEVKGDFTESKTMREALEGAELLVHCAASVGPDRETARRVNVDGTRVVFEEARASDSRLRCVHISTLSVYDTATRNVVDEESPLLTGGNVYGVTKAEGDRVVLESIEAGVRAAILRPGAILGAHPSSSWGMRIPARVRDREISLCGDGSGVLPIVHVHDVCRAIGLALGKDAAIGRVYNLVDDHVTWKRLTDDIREWFGTVPLESVGPGEGGAGERDARFRADRVRKELGYAPTKSYEDGMAEAKRWWDEQ